MIPDTFSIKPSKSCLNKPTSLATQWWMTKVNVITVRDLTLHWRTEAAAAVQPGTTPLLGAC